MRRPACAPPPKIWISGSGSVTRFVAGEVAPQRHAARRGGRVHHRERHRDGRVAAEPRLVRRAVERDQRRVDAGLVERVHARRAPARSDRSTFAMACVDVHPAEARAAVAQVDRFARAARGARGSDRAPARAARERDLGFDAWDARANPRPAGRARWQSARFIAARSPLRRRLRIAARSSATCDRLDAGAPARTRGPRPVAPRGQVLDRRLAVDAGEHEPRQQRRRARFAASSRGSHATRAR